MFLINGQIQRRRAILSCKIQVSSSSLQKLQGLVVGVDLRMFQDNLAQNPGNTSGRWRYLKIFDPFNFTLNSLNFTLNSCLCLAIGGSNKNWSEAQSLIASIRQCQSWSSCGLRLKRFTRVTGVEAMNIWIPHLLHELLFSLSFRPGALMSAPLSTSHFKFLVQKSRQKRG